MHDNLENYMGIIFILFWLIAMGIGILATIFWVWMIIDVAKNEPENGNDKVIWILVVILAGVIGAAVYYFVRRPERMSKFGK
jgi:formate hydrogenlyase subunit 3/multisubunit Na+/H+ antiporter MnhD subunit